MEITETWRQTTEIEVIQSLNAVITTIGVDMVVTPNMNVAKRRVVIRYVINLGLGLDEFSTGRSLSKSLGLPTTNTRVVGTPQVVFFNPIMTIHVYKTTNQPFMSSIIARGYMTRS
jgi:hypothetical protein